MPPARRTQVTLSVPARPATLLRIAGLLAAAALLTLLWRAPAAGVLVTWGLLVPLLPLWWLVAPGLWRSVCPMAAINRLPAALGRRPASALPPRARALAAPAALLAFAAAVAARKAGLDESAPATALALLVLLGLALAGGVAFAGKSGWCGTLCPLGPVQAVYARSPLVLTDSTCKPCLGCTRDCPDLFPTTAHRHPSGAGARADRPRWLMAGALPGLVAGFHLTPDLPSGWVPTILLILVSVAACSAARAAGVRADRVVAVSAALSLNLFYWFNAPGLVQSAATLLGAEPSQTAVWLLRENVAAISLVWLFRGALRPPAPRRAGTGRAASRGIPVTRRDPVAAAPPPSADVRAPRVSVRESSEGVELLAPRGATLAEALAAEGLVAPGGCGQGLCGSDLVHVVAGADRLSPAGPAERRTLERLEAPPNGRLACAARVLGDVEVSLLPQAPADAPSDLTEIRVTHVARAHVVVGGGVAGVTAAEVLRARDPYVRIDLVGDEPGPLYDRMGVNDLLRPGIRLDALRLRDPSWAVEQRIVVHTARAARLDAADRVVSLATGECLPYESLVLATGARAVRPALPGIDLPGVHVLRTAGDAAAIAADLAARGPGEGRVVVLGGGPLGLETAVCLRAAGARVRVLETAPRLLAGFLDERSSDLLALALTGMGIGVALQQAASEVDGHDSVASVRVDGREVPADLVVCCAGAAPDVQLGRAAGLAVRSGIVVDDGMRTSDPHVFAAGDVAEHRGRPGRLWANAERQARVAAANALGGEETYEPQPDVMRLKCPGLDVVAMGRRGDDEPIVAADPAGDAYWRLDTTDGRAVGAILLGGSVWEPATLRTVERGMDLTEIRPRLAAGDWSALREVARRRPTAV